jgi:hypothetical protein
MFKLFERKMGADSTYNKCNHCVLVSITRKLTFFAYNCSKDKGIPSVKKSVDGLESMVVFPEFKTATFLSIMKPT